MHAHAETFFVPYSSMAQWVRQADRTVIDGCFLKCHGRALKPLLAERQEMIHIDALPLYKKYTETFLMDDIPKEERKSVARQVADKIIDRLNEEIVR